MDPERCFVVVRASSVLSESQDSSTAFAFKVGAKRPLLWLCALSEGLLLEPGSTDESECSIGATHESANSGRPARICGAVRAICSQVRPIQAMLSKAVVTGAAAGRSDTHWVNSVRSPGGHYFTLDRDGGSAGTPRPAHLSMGCAKVGRTVPGQPQRDLPAHNPSGQAQRGRTAPSGVRLLAGQKA